jgi:hypothetical protein
MEHTSSEVSVFKPTHELSQIFGNSALAGVENPEDFEKLSLNIESAIKPSDAMGWLFTRDVIDWSWEIRRERILKAETIKYYVREIVGELIKSELAPESQSDAAHFRVFGAGEEFERWVSDPGFRAGIDKELAAKGYDRSFILAQAYMRGIDKIEAIDKRIAFHEQRRSSALKESRIWSERLQRQLEQATSDVIDAEFTEAAE